MKKTFKKIAALLLAGALAATAAMPAFAEGETPTATTHKIKNNSTTNHTYEIYQIFTGKYNSETNQLENLKYGQNAKGTTGDAVTAADLKKLSEYTDAGDKQALDQKDLAFIETFVTLSNPIGTVAKGEEKPFDEGYYLIKDVDGSLTGDEQYTLYLTSILKEDMVINPKTGTTTSEKKIDDVNDSTGNSEVYKDSADYDIGDFVPYHLKAHTAENVDAYKQYHLTFTDTLEAGRFDAITDPVIKIDGTKISEIAADAGYTATATYLTPATKTGFVVKITFVPTDTTDGALLPKSLNGKDVTIDFTAQLGTGAIIGNPGNINTLQLKYSNNPNSEDDSEEGENEKDTVIVFTYDLVVNKTDEGQIPLKGATFALYKKYTDAQLTATGKTAVDEIKYDENKKTYEIPEGTKYVQVGSDIDGTDKTTFTFTGVDDGEYLLVEKKAPTGYNVLPPKTFSITADHTLSVDINDETKKDGKGNYVLNSVSGNGEIQLQQHTKKDGNIDGASTDVINESGTQLPSTGGMGTTIFYVIGGILILAAAIILISRRRVQQ